MAGILYRLKTGCQWKALPNDFSSPLGGGVTLTPLQDALRKWIQDGAVVPQRGHRPRLLGRNSNGTCNAMRSNAWHWLLISGLSGCVGAATACSSSSSPRTAGSGGASAGTDSAGGAPTGGSAPLGGMGGAQSGGTTAVGGSAGAATGAGGAGAGAAGGAAAGAGTAGNSSGGGTAVTLVTPIMRSATSYVLEFGNTYLEVNPAMGSRIVDVHLKGGTNVLGGMGDNAGATFWPSPQSAWTWPPTAAASITDINDKPFTPSSDTTSMSFVGMASAAAGISVTKKLTADLAKEAVVVDYTMIGTASGKSVAPWEITRFPQAGVTFYPTGSTPVAGNGMVLPATTTGAGCTWLTAPSALPAADQKMNADGMGGWLAHAANGWVVVKKFTDTSAAMTAPAEAEIEIYLSSASNYMEVEIQGAYGAVAQGAMVKWTVTWFVRQLPSGVTATAGNQQLVDFVSSLVQ